VLTGMAGLMVCLLAGTARKRNGAEW